MQGSSSGHLGFDWQRPVPRSSPWLWSIREETSTWSREPHSLAKTLLIPSYSLVSRQ